MFSLTPPCLTLEVFFALFVSGFTLCAVFVFFCDSPGGSKDIVAESGCFGPCRCFFVGGGDKS